MTPRNRAFTLIELMIVIAIVLALSGLALAGGLFTSGDRVIGDSEKGLSASIDEARAMAIRQDWPVRLVALARDEGPTLISAEAWPRSVSGEIDSETGFEDEEEASGTVLYELPRGLGIAPDDGMSGLPHETDIFLSAEPVPTTLVDVYPDGRVSIGSSDWVLTFDERTFAPILDAWTGLLRFEPVPDVGDHPAYVGLDPETDPL